MIRRIGKAIDTDVAQSKQATVGVIKAITTDAPLSVFSSMSEIEHHYGSGVRAYFRFANDIAWLHVPLLFLQLMLYVIVYQDYGTLFGLYPSHFPPQYLPLWRNINAACIALTLIFPVFYFFKTQWTYEIKDIRDENVVQDDIIEANKNITSLGRVHRYLITYTIFAILHAIQVGVLVYLDSWSIKVANQQKTGEETSGKNLLLTQIILTTVLTIFRSLFDMVAPMLTNFERHKTNTTYRYHNCFKLVMFRLTSIFLMTFLRGYYATECSIDIIGHVYLVHVLTDLVVSNILEWAVPVASWMFTATFAKKGNVEEARPAWDTDEEFLEIICRQFAIYSGLASAGPLFAFIGLVIAALEVYLDKARLIHVCRKPKKTVASMKGMTTLYMIISTLLALANWGGGSLYTIVGHYWSTGAMTCPILAHHAVTKLA
jgi:hypothetical protein